MANNKQSDFTTVTELSSSAYIPAFTTAENEKISRDNFFEQIRESVSPRFIYKTIDQLQSADLEADEDDPTYVRCEETEYRLYKITSVAASGEDISLDNGTTATYQLEHREEGFVVGIDSSTAGALAVFADTSGEQLGEGATPTTVGNALIEITSVSQKSYPRINADDTTTAITVAQLQTDLSLPANTVTDLALKAPLASPALTGTPTVPTAAANTNTTQAASTAYVQTEILDRVQFVDSIADLTALTGLADEQAVVVTGTDGGLFVADIAALTEDGFYIIESGTVGTFLVRKTVNANTRTLPDVAALRLVEGAADGDIFNTLGHTTAGKGGGQFYCDTSDVSSADNGGSIIVTSSGLRMKLQSSSVTNVMCFGALADGASDDTPAIQAAHDSLGSRGGTLFFPAGDYIFVDPVVITKTGVCLQGSGIQSTRLLPYSNTDTTSIFKIGNAGGVTLQLQIRDFGFRGFTISPSVENWTGIAIDATTYPLIDSMVENLWFSMSFDTPYCIKGVLSSTTIKNCIFELSGGSIYAHSVSGVGSVYNSIIEGCVFWRTIGAVRLGIGTGSTASLEVRDCNIGSHYSGAGIYVESGDLTASDIRFDVNTQWVGSTSRALRLDGGTAEVTNLKVRKIVNGAAGSDLAEAIYMQGSSSLTLQGGSIRDATYGLSSISTGELLVNGTDFQDLSEHGVYPATNNLTRQIIKGCAFTRIGLGAGANKDACRIKAAYGVVSGCSFYDDGTSLMRHVIIDSTTTVAEVLDGNSYFGGEGGSPVISSTTGCRAEFPLSTAPAFGSWAVGSRVRFTAPTAAGKIGSVCTTAGSPGTWKSYGAIDA